MSESTGKAIRLETINMPQAAAAEILTYLLSDDTEDRKKAVDILTYHRNKNGEYGLGNAVIIGVNMITRGIRPIKGKTNTAHLEIRLLTKKKGESGKRWNIRVGVLSEGVEK